MTHRQKIVSARALDCCRSFTFQCRIAVLCCLLAGTGEATAQSIVLFDGHSLSGWVTAEGDPVTEGWKAADGVLYRDGPGGNIFYKEPVGDFELRFEWKMPAGGNSGVKYRVRKFDDDWLGCEYQIVDYEGALGTHSAGSLYALYAPRCGTQTISHGQWHAAMIRVSCGRIEHWLNGVRVVTAVVGSCEWRARVAASKFSDYAGFGENHQGRIMLQDHGTDVWFRNVVLVPLHNQRVASIGWDPIHDFMAGRYRNGPTVQSDCRNAVSANVPLEITRSLFGQLHRALRKRH